LGLEVEGIEDPTAQLGAFRICRVIEAVQHPNADRLRVCRVETWPDGPGGRTEEVQVVCGAPNAKTGLVGVFAPPGTHVPGTGVDLKPGNIRGVDSQRHAVFGTRADAVGRTTTASSNCPPTRRWACATSTGRA
jgi:phenylalanyl-tRNA synthetase beta chain